jgi:hypothetical protein
MLSYTPHSPHVKDDSQAQAFVGGLAGGKDDDVLVVYPFDGDEQLIEKAAEGLKEASGVGPYNGDSSPEAVGDAMEIETKTGERHHFLTVRVEDYKRLEPGIFLNDTLVDFWMRW